MLKMNYYIRVHKQEQEQVPYTRRTRASELEFRHKQIYKELSIPTDECDNCRDIRAILRIIGDGLDDDLKYSKHLFPQPEDGMGYRLADIGRRFLAPSNTSCRLCLMLVKSRVNIEMATVKSEQNCVEDDSELRALYFPQVSGLIDHLRPIKNNPFGLFIGRPECFQGEQGEVTRKFISAGRNGVAVLSKPQRTPNLLSPRPIPEYYEPKLICDWIRYCQKYHKDCLPNSYIARDIQLIDCDSRRIKPAAKGDHYVALSYVWGNSDTQLDYCDTQHAGDSTKLPVALPRVIEDAISVTRALGYHYLWVDKYCIDQNDCNTKHDQIQQMHIIYEKAELTIVAACGVGQNNGLAGVDTPRSGTETIELGNSDLSWVVDPQQTIRASRWSTRGWTFQEAVLARRRLVFTEEQAYFECNVMNCYENLHIPLDALHYKTKAKMKNMFREGMFGGRMNIQNPSRHQLHLQYCACVEDYSRRELTYDADVLNAFLGIIQRFESIQAKEASKELQGALVAFGLSWNFFCHSLCWYHHESASAKRRPQFPSWTWLGWSGGVRFPVAGENVDFRPCYEDLTFQSQSGVDWWKTPPREDWSQSSISTYPILCLEAYEVAGSMIAYSRRPKAEYAETRPSWTLLKQDAKLYLENPISELRLWRELMNGSTWRCFLLGYDYSSSRKHGSDTAPRDYSWVMLLTRTSSDTWSRAGMFQVYCNVGYFQLETQKNCRNTTTSFRIT
ncbi:heterokaryon incompatibility protein-domain-containing protein [Xylaria scruposa]|nr:heterokaryon incompatibility protein-domain-containing protein [Xylaria scruposa]